MQAFWERIRRTTQFTVLSEILPPTERRPLVLDECPTVYMGAGWFIGCDRRKFRMDGDIRVKYGDEGMYAFSVLYFDNPADVCTHLFLPAGTTLEA